MSVHEESVKKMSNLDAERLKQAESLRILQESEAYQNYLRPFLINLSQEGYPNPKDYSNNEKLILDYTQKVGVTDACKEIIQYIESQVSIIDAIMKKYADDHLDGYKI